MNPIESATGAIKNVPRPFLIGGAVIGVGIGGVILWRRRNADPNAGGSIGTDEKNYGQASQNPSSDFGVYAGTTAGEYSSTVASDYAAVPPMVSVGNGALSLEDLLQASQAIIDAGQYALGGGGTTNAGTTNPDSGAGEGTAQTAPSAPPPAPAVTLPAQGPASGPTHIIGTASAPVAAVPVTHEQTAMRRPTGGLWDGKNVYLQDAGSRKGQWYYVVVRNGVKYRYYQNGDVVKAAA